MSRVRAIGRWRHDRGLAVRALGDPGRALPLDGPAGWKDALRVTEFLVDLHFGSRERASRSPRIPLTRSYTSLLSGIESSAT